MCRSYTSIAGIFSLLLCMLPWSGTYAQSFNKGSLLVSLSEGGAYVKYTTTDISNDHGAVVNDGHISGDRDPLMIEYGLTRHWGIGLNMGADIFNVKSADYCHVNTPKNNVQVITSDVTMEANYHFLTNNLVDFSGFASAGFASVSFKGNDGDRSYQYTAGGGIVRIGAKARYYVCKRFGVMGILSTYTANCTPKDIKDNSVASRYATRISGYAAEFGLCYRIFR